MECWFHQTGPSGPTSNPDHISHIAKSALRCLLIFRSGHPGGWALSCEMLSCPSGLESLESLEGPPRGELQDLSQPVSPGVPGIPGGPSPGEATGPKPTREPWSPWSPWRALMADAREFASGAPGHGRDPAAGPRGLEAQVLPYPGNPQFRPVKDRNR